MLARSDRHSNVHRVRPLILVKERVHKQSVT